jgi:integrase
MAFNRIRRAAGLPDDLWFEDLRRTAVVQLAEAGLTESEIAAFTGHSPTSVAQMMKIYRPTNIKMAEHGMVKLLKYRSRLKPEGTDG